MRTGQQHGACRAQLREIACSFVRVPDERTPAGRRPSGSRPIASNGAARSPVDSRTMIVRCIVILVALSAPARADEPTGRFELGAGFSPDDGFLAHAEIAQDDLFDTGQRLSLSADLTARWQAFRIAHGADDVLGTGLDLQTELFTERRALPGFTREGTGGAITLGRQLDGATRAYLRYRIEDVAVALDPAPARIAPGRLGDGLLATLRAGLVHETRGHRLELWAETADRRLGSDHELMRIGASLDHARPLGPLTLRLHGRGSLVRAPGGVPLAERLFHDGHADVRGYPIGAIASGDTFEGLGRAELELPVWRAAGLSVAGFADAGLRGSGNADLRLHRSVGASILWRSPIGPLRFDWAIPLDAADRTPQFLFWVGGP